MLFRTLLAPLAALVCAALARAQDLAPGLLPGVAEVLAPPANATLYTNGSLVHITYNGVAGGGFWTDGLEVYLLSYAFGTQPAALTGVANGYGRFGGVRPLANLPPNAFQNATTRAQRAANEYNQYDYTIPLPNNTLAGNTESLLTVLEFYHSPQDEGFTWVTLNYWPVKLVSS